MMGELFADRVVVKETRIQRLIQRGFGTKKEDHLELSLLEALFLMERGSLEVFEKGKKIERDYIVKRAGDEGDFSQRFSVYRELRERGYVVKTGFKFGAHFRVYQRGEYSDDGHSSMLVHVVSEDSGMTFPELSRAVRLTQSVKKKLVFAVVDHEGDITYYQIDRIIP
jgi:tRNA-intron endonuclease